MSFAAVRRLRRRFGLSNAERVVEGRKYLVEELASRSGPAGKTRRRPSALVETAGIEPSLRGEVAWAAGVAERSDRVEPSDSDVERFFDALELLYGVELAASVDPRDLIGRTVGDRYKVEAVVGEGAAGVVYRARHVETGALVALKLLHPSKVLRREIIGELEHPRRAWEELVARFRREARAAANVQHPGIVSVFDFGAEGVGFYQAMEYLTGETLKEVIAREAPMNASRAVQLIHAAATALDAAHARGVVHRDLKPANLFLCHFEWGKPLKVLDFGIAKVVQSAEEEVSRLTETGVFLGTYRYASPEQCLGEAVTPASDVYSLAVTLFEMLAGRPPFDGPSSVLAIRHATAPAPRLDEFRHDLPEGLADVVERALSKQPHVRPARGGDLALALAPFLGMSGAAPPQRSPRRIPADELAEGPLPAPRTRAHPAVTMAGGTGGTIHRDPESFARFLVDELIQYFPRAIEEGRAGRDIYRRLRNEIDVRWSLYTTRFSGEEVDHFYKMLVEHLAGGDADALGPGLPDSSTHERRRRRAHHPDSSRR